MILEVITPEKEIFKGEVDAVQFPGINGSFQVLENHAPIISALSAGTIKVDLKNADQKFDDLSGEIENDKSNDKVIRLTVKGGVVELRNNRIIVLAD